MMQGICKLCGQERTLNNSHFIPNFAIKWIKKTSATGYLRRTDKVNKRVQDYIKEYWLCRKCENLFSQWENKFSKNIFYPFINDNKTKIIYERWMAKFAASLSWRTLSYFIYKSRDDEDIVNQAVYLKIAETHLKNFLLEKTDNLLQFEQHFYPLGAAKSTDAYFLSRNINRYFSRCVDMDLLFSSTDILVYTKLPSFIFLGLIKCAETRKMRTSRISLKYGNMTEKTLYFPTGLMEYISERSDLISGKHSRLNSKQHQKISNFILQNPEKAVSSMSFRALLDDYKLFGGDIF